MRFFSIFVAALAAGLFLTAHDAEAKRRGIPIVIPGMSGGSEEIVKVLDLPDIPALQREDGTYIDLGYLFHRRSGGEWIGYVGSNTRYLKLGEERLQMLLNIAGVSQLPPVPVRATSATGGGIGLLIGIVLLIGVAALVWKGVRALSRGLSAGSTRAGARASQAVDYAPSGDGTFDPDEAIKAYLRKNPEAADRIAGRGTTTLMPRPAMAGGARPQFGKRGL